MSHIRTLEANNQQLANQNSWKKMRNVRSGALHIPTPLCSTSDTTEKGLCSAPEHMQSGVRSQKLVLRLLVPLPNAPGPTFRRSIGVSGAKKLSAAHGCGI